MSLKNICSVVLIAAVTGCVSTPKVLQGDYSSITPAESKINHKMNQRIRWSGYLVNTINKKDKTCFEIIETQTSKSSRPVKIIPKKSSRFLACKEGFYDPAAFNKRMVTITGNLVAFTTQKIEEFDYEYPVVKTDLIYIWQNINPNRNFRSLQFYANFNSFHCRHSYISGYCY